MPEDAPDLVEQAVKNAKAKFCEGQTPAPFTPEQYNALTQWGKDYVRGNMQQWQSAGCSLED